MKRFLLIAAGTVGGLGAVLSVTPPQLGAADLGLGLDMGTLTTPDATVSTPAVVNNSPAVSTPTKKPTKPQSTKPSPSSPKGSNPAVAATPTQAASSTPTQAASSTPTPVQTPTTPAPTKTATPTPVVKSITGDFTGPVVNVSYGNVQVQITVINGKITDAQALIAPTGKNDKYTRKALPILKQQTLAAQSTNIQGASGASYTTYGWRKSLQGAMVKAGL
jgi:uncharacterized protein with FMN-binding domain